MELRVTEQYPEIKQSKKICGEGRVVSVMKEWTDEQILKYTWESSCDYLQVFWEPCGRAAAAHLD